MTDKPQRPHPIAIFKQNYSGFFHTYRFLLLIFVIALLCDGLSTVYFMQTQGPNAEVHPAIRLASNVLGTIAGPLLGALGKALAALAVAIYCRRIAPYLLLTASALSFWAAWYNIWGADCYIPRILQWLP